MSVAQQTKDKHAHGIENEDGDIDSGEHGLMIFRHEVLKDPNFYKELSSWIMKQLGYHTSPLKASIKIGEPTRETQDGYESLVITGETITMSHDDWNKFNADPNTSIVINRGKGFTDIEIIPNLAKPLAKEP